MDPVTHGLIGASAAQLFTDKVKLRAASFIGFSTALLADLDIFIHSENDPLLNVEIHRQFTHSFIFIPVGALIGTALLWWFVRKKLSLKETYIFALAGYATAGIADSMTSYGTQLLWPFFNERFAWNLISVFDPLFTVGIIIALAWGFYHKTKKGSYRAFGWILLYLSFGFIQQNRVAHEAFNYAEANGHKIERLVIKPTIGNQILWGARYTAGDSVHTLGIRPGVFASTKIYPGETTLLLKWKEAYAAFEGSTLFDDLERFSKLSDGFLIEHPTKENIIGDGRYSMLPTTITPLWGVEIDTTEPEKHLNFLNFRELTTEQRENFLRMILGQELNGNKVNLQLD